MKAMLFRVVSLALVCGVCACTPAAETAQEAANQINDNVKYTVNTLKEYATLKPPRKDMRPIQQGYCYRVMQDIVCYDQPQAGAENRFVGGQAANTPTPRLAGIPRTTAMPPRGTVMTANAGTSAPQVMKPLPPAIEVSKPVEPKADPGAEPKKSFPF